MGSHRHTPNGDGDPDGDGPGLSSERRTAVSGVPPCNRILIVDDNPAIHVDFGKILSSFEDAVADPVEDALFGTSAPAPEQEPKIERFTLGSAYQGQDALALLEREIEAGRPYAMCFLDIRMPPGWDGPQTLIKLWDIDPNLQVVFCTAYSDYSWHDLFTAFGRSDGLLFLKKPFTVSEVRQLAYTLTEKWRLARENELRMHDLENRVTERTRELREANDQLYKEMAERAAAQSELRKAQGLQALGRLAAGIGHEINNPLAYVVGSIEAAQVSLAALDEHIPGPQYRELDEFLGAAHQGSDRIAQIVHTIRVFSRSTHDETELVDISAAIEFAISMVKGRLGDHIQLETDMVEAQRVPGKRVELERVFMNLLENAAYAVSDPACQDTQIRVSSCRDGNEVLVEVADRGSGIAPENLDKIFDPFFTTKPVGQGSGLGLAICHTIVSSLGGSIEVTSTENLGTAVTIRLPSISLPPQENATETANEREPEPEPDAEGQTARGRILVVDDEPLIVKVIAHALRDHVVVTATGGRDALAHCLSESFDVILCDMMMSDMTGMELYRTLQRSRPEIVERIIFITGGAHLDEVRQFLEEVPNECIEKPISRVYLQKRVSTLLGRRLPDDSTG